MIGQTKDAGFQIGVSRTLPHDIDFVWRFLTGADGLRIWLGDGAALDGGPYRTAGGTTGELRSRHERDRVRLTWQPAGWDHDTTVQVTVSTPASGRTTLRFHQERLTGPEERERQRRHWRAVMDAMAAAMGRSTPRSGTPS
ncbi:SRPBCC family protein [Actinoplanes sp. CA-030573]|uniref:SRPBCC family protein n=1 Tax=Actinoplanes sp. CA-030573 TaxID=3239898 RepID=UPI003D8FCFD2